MHAFFCCQSDRASAKLRLRALVGPNSEVVVAAPVAAEGMVYLTAGHPPRMSATAWGES